MKKELLLLILLLSTLSASAQVLRRDAELITLQDTDVYMFNPVPNKLSKEGAFLGRSTLSLGQLVQKYVPQNPVTLYGIALTISEWNDHDSIFQNPEYNAVLMQRPYNVPDSVYHGTPPPPKPPYTLTYRTLRYLDSLAMDTTQHSINITSFQYEFNYPKQSYVVTPCYEVYFDEPCRMTDTFYVGRKYMAILPTPREYGGWQNRPPDIDYFWYFAGVDTTMFQSCNYWGFAFPIIGFHCKPLDEAAHSVLVTETAGGGITVQWYSVEDGASYNVRLVSVDGSVDTLVVTSDSSYTFSGLPTDMRYNVQVRKQCYYATPSYDTTVYSPWTTPVSFISGSDECPPVSTLRVTASPRMAQVSWLHNPCYTAVQISYGTRNLPQSQWMQLEVHDTTGHYTLTGLEPERHYSVVARGVCGRVGTMSPWSEQVYFSTLDDTVHTDTVHTAIVQMDGMDFSVSPNPVHGTLVVSFMQPLSEDGVLTLYDLGGREVRRTTVAAGSTKVDFDTEGCPAGAYLLKLITARGITTRHLLVE